MSTEDLTPFEKFLNEHDDAAWREVVAELLPHVHEVDRNAVQIWFAFFPLALLRAFRQSEDPRRLAGALQMQGRWLLADQIDTSHTFLYGHRYWPEVRRAVVALAEAGGVPEGAALAARIRESAARVASGLKVEPSLVVGIAAVACMTLQQAGLDALRSAPGVVQIDKKYLKKTPEQILSARARDDRQGLFGFLRTEDKLWTVVWDENAEGRRFKALHLQEVASAAAGDKRPWHERDARCTVDEGPIPVQCRSASCGTCWVGVLGGAEKLTEVAARERRKMPEMGYIDTDDPRPLIRLSCQAQATGALSIVIPPWNGFFGKYLKRQREAPAGGGEAVQASEATA